jgi:hypothetical protein
MTQSATIASPMNSNTNPSTGDPSTKTLDLSGRN